MPEYKLPKFSTEELLAAFGSRVSPAGVIRAGTEGLKHGADLAATIAETKGKKLKQQQDIEEIERKLAAQELLAKTVENQPKFEKLKKEVQQPLTTTPITQVGGKAVTPTLAQTPAGAQQMEAITAQEEQSKRLGDIVRAGYGQEVVKGMLETDKTGPQGFGSKGFQQTNIMITAPDGTPQTLAAGFDIATGQIVNPYTQQPIKDLKKDLQGLLPRGYAINFNYVGVTADNKPILKADKDPNFYVDGQKYTGTVFPKLENAPAGIVDSISSLNSALFNLDQLQKSNVESMIGPLAGRVTSVADAIGLLGNQGAEMVGYLRTYQNMMIKAITGAQMSEPEAKRIMGQMPSLKDNPQAFLAKLKVSRQNAEMSLKNKLEALRASNYIFKDPITEERARQIAEELSGISTQETSTPVTGMTPEKRARLEELRAKKAAGTLR